jgi:hypothetical protein
VAEGPGEATQALAQRLGQQQLGVRRRQRDQQRRDEKAGEAGPRRRPVVMSSNAPL